MLAALAHGLAQFTSVVKQCKRSSRLVLVCSHHSLVSTLLCPFFLHLAAYSSTMQLALH